MASKTFYECGCMEQGEQFFPCASHTSEHGPVLAELPEYAALVQAVRETERMTLETFGLSLMTNAQLDERRNRIVAEAARAYVVRRSRDEG